MNRYIQWFAMLFAAFTLNAQNFTLQQCIDYALLNQASYQNATLDEEIARAKVGEIRGIGLPHISASGTYMDNIVIQKAFLPSDAFSSGMAPLFSIFRALDNTNVNNALKEMEQAAAKQDPITALDFGVKYSTTGSLTASQIIFNGSYIVGLQSSKTFLALSQKSKDATKATIIQNVKKAYLGVLVFQERMKLLDVNITRLDSTFAQLKASNEAGFVEKIDVDRLEVQLNNLKIEKQKIQNLYDFGLLALKFQMGMPLKEQLAPTENLDAYKNELSDISGEVNYDNKPEFALLSLQKRANELELKNLRYERFPTLAAFGNLGANTGSNKFEDMFTGTYYSFSNIGLSLNVPIFDGTQRHYKISAAKLNIKKTENNLKNLQLAIDFQAANAKVNFQNNKQTLANQEKNMDLAKRVLEVAQKKFKSGVGSNLEVITAEADYKEALVNYYSTLYDVLVNKVDYDYAIGNLK